MYEVSVESSFHASHAVHLPSGDMEPLHWHHWRVEVLYQGSRLDAHGLLVDFVSVMAQLRDILDPLEGATLNGHSFLAGVPASTEEVARRIFESLAGHIGTQASLAAVTVHEAPGCSARYGTSRTVALSP